MQIAYIISAYKRPDLLFRLVDALDGAPIAIHVDRKSDIGPEVESRARAHANVTLLPRHVCHWGLFGHVEASLEGLKWFMGAQADYAALLTGQCYPIKPKRVIEQALENLGGRSMIEISRFPKAEWLHGDDGGYKRLDRFYLKFPRRLMPKAIRLWKRRPPYHLHPYGGSGYWLLSREAIAYIRAYVAGHPQLTRYFRTTFCPDEMFFQTILGNSPLNGKLVSKLLHYTDWSKGGASPAMLRSSDLPTLQASDALFARKFDDHETLDMIDALLLRIVPDKARWEIASE